MSLTADQQKLYNLAVKTLPKLLTEINELDPLKADAVAFDLLWTYIQDLVEQTYILDAYGVYLNQHATDNNMHRQKNETDASLRSRILTFQDAQTKSAILTQVNNTLVANGLPASAALLELRLYQAHFNRGNYFSRGWRMGHSGLPSVLIIILPVGTSLDVEAAVEDIVRLYKSAGKVTWFVIANS